MTRPENNDPHLLARVARAEEQIAELQHRQESRAGSTAYAVGLVHEDVRALRAEMGEGFDAVNERFDGINERLDTLTSLVEQLVQRGQG